MIYKIIIDNSSADSIDYLYSTNMWKGYVCENVVDNVIIFGNKDYVPIQEAYWWVKTINLIDDIDYNYNQEDEQLFISDFENNYNESILKKIWNIYWAHIKQGGYSDDIDLIILIAENLFKIELENTTIKGYNQGDWNNAIYIKGCLDPDILADYYFGNLIVIDIYADEDIIGTDIIPESQIDYTVERNGEYYKNKYNGNFYTLTDKDTVIVQEFNGKYVQTPIYDTI